MVGKRRDDGEPLAVRSEEPTIDQFNTPGEYAEALKQKASTERGGISLAQRNQMAASGALQRKADVQAARDENKRGNKAQDIELEKELANVSQQGAAQQMQGIDALSQQQAQMSKARRDQLEMAALQTRLLEINLSHGHHRRHPRAAGHGGGSDGGNAFAPRMGHGVWNGGVRSNACLQGVVR